MSMTSAQREADVPSAALLSSALANREHGGALGVKLLFFALHTIGVATAVWLVAFGGVSRLGLRPRAELRSALCLAAVLLYWARHALTLFYLLHRRVKLAEAVPLGVFMALWAAGSALLSSGVAWPHFADCAPLDWLSCALVLCGSYLNSASELERKAWKARPENKGHCYTQGLWALSMHVNYFGDILLFSGWAALSGSPWAACLPAAIAYGFAFHHVPELDAYLEGRYGDEFREWAARTPRLIPFVW